MIDPPWLIKLDGVFTWLDETSWRVAQPSLALFILVEQGYSVLLHVQSVTPRIIYRWDRVLLPIKVTGIRVGLY